MDVLNPATRTKIAAGLDQAIRTETAGHHFYLMAARATGDPKGQAVLRTLAQEELDHLRFLKHQRESIVEKGLVDSRFELGPQADLSGDNPIFSAELKKRVDQAHYEMSALSIGIQLELNSLRYYSEQAEAAEHQAVRDFYERLADWESGHYHALLRQQEDLKEDYWAAGGFAPF